METIRNPLLASFPLGSLPGLRLGPPIPLRLGIITGFTLLATVFAFPSPEPLATAASEPAAAADAPLPDAVESPPAGDAAGDQTVGDTPAVTNGQGRDAAAAPVSGGLAFGAFVALVFFGSTLLHVAAEAWAAERSGGEVAAIVLWPVGGRTVATELDGAGWMQTAVAGPAVHAVLCLLTLPAVVSAGATGAFSLFSLPAVSFSTAALSACGLIIFGVNVKLLAVSLLPIPPLGGSRLIRGWNLTTSATGREDPAAGGRWAMFSLAASMLVATSGIVWDNPWISALGALLLACACVEVMAYMPSASRPAPEEESVGGYDFSQGYTSLERDDEEDLPREPSPGPLARWKAKRDAERRQREIADREAAERAIDRLLAKVGEVGMKGLTDSERAELTKLSAKFKSD